MFTPIRITVTFSNFCFTLKVPHKELMNLDPKFRGTKKLVNFGTFCGLLISDETDGSSYRYTPEHRPYKLTWRERITGRLAE